MTAAICLLVPLMAVGTVLYFVFQYRGKKALSLCWNPLPAG